jgi:predicted ATPase
MDNSSAEQLELNPVLIEREEEMELLCRRMDEAKRGWSTAVILSGEPGLGKTRMTEEAEREARERGLLFLRGAGDSRQAGLAYGVFVQELGVYLEHVSADERDELRQAVAEFAPHLWGSLFPTEPPPKEAPEMLPDLRQALFLARLGRLLLKLSQRQPIVLCLEDLHWADSASLQLLSFLASRNSSASMFILGTYRPGEQEGREELDLEKMLRELQLKKNFQVHPLEPMTDEGTRKIVASCFSPHGFTETLLQWLYRRSGGVPLFIVQFLEFLVERGVISRKDDLWVNREIKEKQEPDSVRAVLRQRLQRLEAQERQILSYASVQGDRFEGRLVARTLGVPLTVVMRVLGELMRNTRLVRIEERKLRFSHTLLTEAFYEMLPEERRKQAHARLGNILEDQGLEDAEVLAYHFFHAGAHSRALPHLLEAARRSRASFAYREAQTFLQQVETVVDSLGAEKVHQQRLEGLLMLAEIEERLGNPGRAMALCRQVLAAAGVDDRSAQAKALKQMGWMEYRQGNWEKAIELHWDAQHIFTELGDEQQAAVVYLRLGNIAFERSDLREAEMRYRDAMKAAIKNANHSLLGSVYGNLAVIATVRGEYVEAVLGYTNALNAYRRINHTYGLCQTHHNLGMAHAAQEEWQEALRSYGHAQQLAGEMGTVDMEANVFIAQATAQTRVGDLAEASVLCRQARGQMEELEDRLGLAECDKVEGMILRERCQYLQAEKMLRQGRRVFEELENQLGMAECDLELGSLLQTQGDLEGARQRLEESQKLFQDIGAEVDAHRAEEILAALAS